MKNTIENCFYTAIFFLVCIVLSYCSKKSEEPVPDSYTLYKIPSGSHETTNPLVFKTTQVLQFKARFDSSAIYTTIDPLNQNDTNKLLGFSDCGGSHLNNSARFGWRWYNDNLEIMAYCYVDGVRPEPLVIDTVQLNTINNYKLEFKSDRYVFTLNDTVSVEVPKTCNYTGSRYKLYPYFGGDENAPHEIRIWIKEE